MRKLRNSGLPTVGSLPWGTHACLIYESHDALLEILAPYVQAGLAQHEVCLWIRPESLSEQEARDALARVLPDAGKYLGREQLRLVSPIPWYRNGRGLDCGQAFENFMAALEAARAAGFAGLRCIGGPGPISEPQEWQDFLAYEAQCNGAKEEHALLGLCTYALSDCSATQLLDLMQRHQAVLTRREGQWRFIEHRELRSALVLEEQAGRFQRLKDVLPVGIFETDAKGRCTYLNDYCSRMIGLRKEDALGDGWWRALHPEDLASLQQQWAEAVERHAPLQAEYRLVRSDGSILWVLGQKVPLCDDAAGFLGYVGTLTDISEQKRVQETLEDCIEVRTRKLAEVNASLLEKIQDLEQFHDVVVGREVKMIELEQEAARLRKENERLRTIAEKDSLP